MRIPWFFLCFLIRKYRTCWTSIGFLVFSSMGKVLKEFHVFSLRKRSEHTADAPRMHSTGSWRVPSRERSLFFTTTRIQHLYQLLVQNQLCRPLDATLSPSDGQAVQLCRKQECSTWRHPTTVIDARAISFSQAIKDSTGQSARLTRLRTHQQVRDASPRVPGKQGDQFTPNRRRPRGSVKTQARTPS